MSSSSGHRPTITVLGASGYLGSAVAALLSRTPVRLRLAARGPSAVPANSRAEVEPYTGDLTAPGNLARVVSGADAVVHLVRHNTGATTWRVAEEDRGSERVNLGLVDDLVGVLRTNRSAGPPPVVVLAGSTSQSGAPTPATAYDRQKEAAERGLRDATAEGWLRGVSLRLPTVFGCSLLSGGRDVGVVSAMVRRALAGQPLTLWNDGTVERDLLFVDDAARAFQAALDHADTLAGRHWDIGTGRGTALVDLFTTIAAMVGRHTGEPEVSVHSVAPPAEATATDFRSCVADPAGFQRVTGWSPELTLPQGLGRTIDVLAEEYRQ